VTDLPEIPPLSDDDAPRPTLVALPATAAPAVPSSLEAEIEALACPLVVPESIRQLRELLSPEQMHWERHQLVFAAMCSLDDRGIAADLVTVGQELRDCGWWDRVGGSRVLGDLLSRVGATSHLPHYAEIVRTKWAHRRILSFADALRAIGLDGYDIDASLQAIDRAYRALSAEIGERSLRAGSAAALAAEHEAMVERSEQVRATGSTLAVPFGLRSLDEALHGGIWGGEQCVIMGARGMGKSALAAQLVATNCRAGRRAVFVSAEMPPEQVFGRLIAKESGVPYHVQRSGKMTGDEAGRVDLARSEVSRWPLDVLSSGSRGIGRIERDLRQVVREVGDPAVIVLDYAQKVSRGGLEGETALAAISGAWKALALDLGCASLLLSQPVTSATRHAGPPPYPRPVMADSKGAGAIPDDADTFLVVHRRWLGSDQAKHDATLRRQAEIGIDKQREGSNAGAEVRCLWDGASMTFREGEW